MLVCDMGFNNSDQPRKNLSYCAIRLAHKHLLPVKFYQLLEVQLHLVFEIFIHLKIVNRLPYLACKVLFIHGYGRRISHSHRSSSQLICPLHLQRSQEPFLPHIRLWSRRLPRFRRTNRSLRRSSWRLFLERGSVHFLSELIRLWFYLVSASQVFVFLLFELIKRYANQRIQSRCSRL